MTCLTMNLNCSAQKTIIELFTAPKDEYLKVVLKKYIDWIEDNEE